MLEIKNMKKSFGDMEVLRGVDIKVEKGDVVTVIGPSGSGKTTLLRLSLINISQPTTPLYKSYAEYG